MIKGRDKLMKRWIEALRSGEYEQGKAHLRGVTPDGQPDQFCCLGVLCEIGGLEFRHSSYYYEDARVELEDEYDLSNEDIFCDSFLPAPFAKDVGVPEAGFKVAIDGLPLSLAGHNDNGVSFLAIADAIEGYLELEEG